MELNQTKAPGIANWCDMIYTNIYPSHSYTALVEDEICKNYHSAGQYVLIYGTNGQ